MEATVQLYFSRKSSFGYPPDVREIPFIAVRRMLDRVVDPT